MSKKRITSIIMLAVLAIGIACVVYGVTGTGIYENAANMMGSDKKTAMTFIQAPDKLTELGAVSKVGAANMKAFLKGLGADAGKVDAAVDAFWKANLSRIKAWYPPRHRDDDVVISASPEFLIRPACQKLGVSVVIGSPVDKRTGLFLGPNCHGQEKVSRFRARFPGGRIGEFYSDSRSDKPLAELAERAYLVKGEKLTEWRV